MSRIETRKKRDAGSDADAPSPGFDAERARLAAIVESAEDAIISKTLEGVITSWNVAAERLYGYAAREVVGRHISVIVPPEFSGQLEEIHATLRRGEQVRHLETVRVSKDGTRIPVSVSVSPIRDGEGRVVGAASIARDITEHRRAQEMLRASEELNQAVLNSLSAHIAVLDREGRIVAVNEAWRRFARENEGADAGVDVGASYLDACGVASGGGDADVRAGIRAVLEGRRESFEVEYPCDAPDRPRWFLMNVTPLRLGHGGAVVAHTDITERREAEEALARVSRERELMLEEVSTPLVPVLAGVLVMPLIGTLDTARAQRATQAALSEVRRTGARACIIDITGARIVDSHAVANLSNLAQALRLVGAESIVTGVGSHAAQSIVSLGLDLAGLRTHRTLAQALAALVKSGAGKL